MKRFIFVPFIFFTTALSSFDRFLDISLTTDFANLKERSHIDFNSQVAYPIFTKAILLNPRISLFFDGTMDISVATGVRHEFKYGTLGHHLFWDSSGTKDAHFHQIGHSLDFLTPHFDYRLNYYHPITKVQTLKNYLFSPHKWVEGEVIWKNRICQVGVGPKYNLFEKTWGSQARIVFPFKYFSIGGMVGHEANKDLSGCLSLSFRLFSTPRSSLLQAPISHRSRVQYSKQVIIVPPPVIQKREENPKPPEAKPVVIPKEPEKPEKPVVVEEPKAEAPVVEPTHEEPTTIIEIIPDPTPTPDVPTKTSWWDFFFPRNQMTQIM